MQPNYAGSSAAGVGAGVGGPITGWTFIQDSALVFCTGRGPLTGCTPGLGNIVPTVAGSVWVLYVTTTNNVTITSVTGGGGTWIHCPNCYINNPVDAVVSTVDAWYNLTGNAGTDNLTFVLSGSSGTNLGASFVELLPPPGTTASYDDSRAIAISAPCATCAGASLNNISGTDAILQVIAGGGTHKATWNAITAPYILNANGDGMVLNTTSGAAPSVTFQHTPTPIFMAIAFKSSAGIFTPPTKQYSIVNYTIPPVNSCGNPTPCSITIPATGAGNLLYLQSGDEVSSRITSVTGGGTWVVPSACAVGAVVQAQNNFGSCAYVLSSTAGATTLNVNMSGNGATAFAVYEVATTTGTFILDAIGSTVNSTGSGPGGFYYPGQPLSITGQNDVIFQFSWDVGGSLGPTYYPQAYGGTGQTFNYFLFDEASVVALTDSGPAPATPTWINAVSNQTTFVSGAAFTAVPQVITAADCSAASLQAALNAVTSDGATVIIPSGSCTWLSTVSYTANFSTTIQGQTTVAGTCAPGGSCVATDSTTITNSTGSAALHVTSINGKSLRVTGLTFAQGTGAQQFVGNLFISGGSQSVRVDHNHFLHAGIVDLTLQGNSTAGNLYGVVDHNKFNLGGSNEDGIRVEHYNWNGSVNMVGYSQGGGEGSWTDQAHWGSNQFVFIENNTFAFDGPNTTHAFAFDIDAGGGRIVFRYNNVTPNLALQTHGTGSGDPNFRGSRALEIYGNNFAYVSTTNTFQFLELESGGLYLWNNTVSNYTQMLQLDYVRSTPATYQQSATPGGWGYCSGSPINTVPGPSPWDVGGSGPCVDQTGRGAGDLIHGTFPSKLNTRTNTIAWPNQVAEPSYLWGNVLTSVPRYVNHFASGTIAENSDYYTEVPNIDRAGTFDGTIGIGCGPAAGIGCANPVPRPATCVPFVGYWDPSQNTLFQCSSANTWTPFYTPFTYPHPLITS